LLASARAFFAGLLLLFPGVLSDIAALVILLLPGKLIGAKVAGMSSPGPRAANDDVIEAEFHEVREPREAIEHQDAAQEEAPRDEPHEDRRAPRQ